MKFDKKVFIPILGIYFAKDSWIKHDDGWIRYQLNSSSLVIGLITIILIW